MCVRLSCQTIENGGQLPCGKRGWDLSCCTCETQAVNQTEASPNFTQGQAIPCGNIGRASTMAGTGPWQGVAGPSSVHSGSFARQSTTTAQVSCF